MGIHLEGAVDGEKLNAWLRALLREKETDIFQTSGGQDSGVLLWEPRKGLRPLRFAFLEDEVTCLRWSTRGDPLLGADTRGTIRC